MVNQEYIAMAASTPSMKDLTIDNITSNVQTINSNCEDRRLKYLLERLVEHLHDFTRETRLTTKEWMAAIQFLTQVGQVCSPVRQEFILLSDVLGLSLLVDSVDHPVPEGATDPTVLGPFHTDEAIHIEHGGSISHDEDGEPCLCICTVKDIDGTPLKGVKIDVWETDSKGFYDVQYADRAGSDGRALLESDENGRFWYRSIVPVPYPIPHDGPVGQLLLKLKRHPYRPSHMHFLFEKDGYDPLVTALYLRGDPFESSDAVFGVKQSLIVDLGEVDEEVSKEYGVPVGTKLIKYDFVLVKDEVARQLRIDEARKAMNARGMEVEFIDGLPVPLLD
jgi:protocatechuate 3,4-dioxygenase beta subunit